MPLVEGDRVLPYRCGIPVAVREVGSVAPHSHVVLPSSALTAMTTVSKSRSCSQRGPLGSLENPEGHGRTESSRDSPSRPVVSTCLLAIVKELQETSQLIVVTHQKRTMEIADALYGVTMRDGITTVVSQRLAD